MKYLTPTSIVFVYSRTDEIIQDTLHSNFAECTVITIAHRINTVIDSDKILVISPVLLCEIY